MYFAEYTITETDIRRKPSTENIDINLDLAIHIFANAFLIRYCTTKIKVGNLLFCFMHLPYLSGDLIRGQTNYNT